MQIKLPGIYPDIASVHYHADPCPVPSLTQSVAKILLDQSPLHAWDAHPRLNPDWREDADTKFDVGNIAHKLMIGRGREIAVLEGFDNWRTKAPREARKVATAGGQLAVLGKHFQRAERMVTAAREQLDLRGLGHLFRDGDGEVVAAWQEADIWLRQMIDWLTPDRCTFADYKTTDLSAAPSNLSRMMFNAGWPIQAAMGERGLDALDPANGGRRRYLFVVQEAHAPYCLNVVEIAEGPLTMGRKMLDAAVAIWSACMKRGRWPGYPAEIVTPDYPAWAEAAWLEREEEAAARETYPQETVLGAG